jgi:hypothetical protein
VTPSDLSDLSTVYSWVEDGMRASRRGIRRGEPGITVKVIIVCGINCLRLLYDTCQPDDKLRGV